MSATLPYEIYPTCWPLSECQINQLPYSLLWRVIEREIQPLCLENRVGLICYSPLAQGLLTGRYTTIEDVPEHLRRTRWYAGKSPNTDHDEAGCAVEVFAALEMIKQIADDLDQPMASVALAWVMGQLGIRSLLVGARKPGEVAWNLPAFDLKLADAVAARLAQATELVKEKLGNNPDMWFSDSRMR